EGAPAARQCPKMFRHLPQPRAHVCDGRWLDCLRQIPRFARPMSALAFLLTQSVNALSQAALLFFLGVGLTLIFGLMRIVNFAHGTFYMLGAFVGYSAARLDP